MGESKVSMKLLINSETNKVLFAEAGKDTVDFLFHFMSLPLATVIRLLKEQGMVGCLGNLYESIENLNDAYIQPNKHKDTLLKPTRTTPVPLFLLQGDAEEEESTASKVGFTCCSCVTANRSGFYSESFGASYQFQTYYSDVSGALCGSCKRPMTYRMTYVAPPVDVTNAKDVGGFVKGVVTYMIMDDLVVKPMSTISSITLLNKFNVKDTSALKEKEVRLGFQEAVKLLKSSLQSKQVLTAVFLKNN